MAQSFKKDPDAVLDYSIDWSSWLATGETISTSTWTVPAGITKDSDSKSNTASVIWLSGGTISEVYVLINHIVTSASRTDDRTIYVHMIEK